MSSMRCNFCGRDPFDPNIGYRCNCTTNAYKEAKNERSELARMTEIAHGLAELITSFGQGENSFFVEGFGMTDAKTAISVYWPDYIPRLEK